MIYNLVKNAAEEYAHMHLLVMEINSKNYLWISFILSIFRFNCLIVTTSRANQIKVT